MYAMVPLLLRDRARGGANTVARATATVPMGTWQAPLDGAIAVRAAAGAAGAARAARRGAFLPGPGMARPKTDAAHSTSSTTPRACAQVASANPGSPAPPTSPTTAAAAQRRACSIAPSVSLGRTPLRHR